MPDKQDLTSLLDETQEWAKNKAQTLIKKVGTDKRALAQELYNQSDVKYGFDECLLSGNYAPFPHEVESTAECISFAVIQYFLAKELDLDPRYFFIYGLVSHPENIARFNGILNHAMIDVDIGNKGRTLIDSQLSMYGPVTYDIPNGIVQVRNNYLTENTKKRFKVLEEYSYDALCSRLMSMRTPGGKIGILREGQRTKQQFEIGIHAESSLWIRYSLEDNALETIVNTEIPYFMDISLIKRRHLDNTGNIIKETLQIGGHSGLGWLQFNNWQDIGTYDMDIVKPFWDALDSIVRKHIPNVTRIRKRKTTDLEHMLQENGFDNFYLEDHASSELSSASNALLKEMNAQYQILIAEPKFKKTLEIGALYWHEKKHRILNGTDHQGYIYTSEEHDEWLKEKIDHYIQTSSFLLEQQHKLLYKNFGITSTAPTTDITFIQTSISHDTMAIAPIQTLGRIKHYDPAWYKRSADQLRYYKEFTKEKTTDEIHSLIEEKGADPFDTYRKIIANRLIIAYQARTVLDHRIYIPRVLKEIRTWLNEP